MTNRCAFRLLVLTAACAIASETFAGTAVVIQPVSASGAHTVVGSDIFLPSGSQRVRFEIRVAGWGENHLKTMQVRIDSFGSEEGADPVAHSVASCPGNNNAGHSFCGQTFETGSRCAVGCNPDNITNCRCESGFQNRNRADFVPFGLANIAVVDISTSHYRYGMTIMGTDFVIDPGTSLYLGTMFLDVPAGAQGTYTIGASSKGTFFQNELDAGHNDIPIEMLTPAHIIIGDPIVPGSRYVAFDPDEPGVQTAVRITLTSLYHPGPPVAEGEDRDFGVLEGQVRWLGPPAEFPDVGPENTILAAKTQCTPHFTNWGDLGTVHVYGDAIIPSSIYTIHQVPISCQANPNDPLCLGPPQIVQTGQWGDAAAPFARSDQPAQPDAADLAAIVDSFGDRIGAASKKFSQLGGAIPNPLREISFLDVNLAVDAFRGHPYPYPIPSSCP